MSLRDWLHHQKTNSERTGATDQPYIYFNGKDEEVKDLCARGVMNPANWQGEVFRAESSSRKASKL